MKWNAGDCVAVYEICRDVNLLLCRVPEGKRVEVPRDTTGDELMAFALSIVDDASVWEMIPSHIIDTPETETRMRRVILSIVRRDSLTLIQSMAAVCVSRTFLRDKLKKAITEARSRAVE